MEKLPNELLYKILLYMSMKQLFNLSLTSKIVFYLVKFTNSHKEFVTIVWNIYKSKQSYFSFIESCQKDIVRDLRLSFDVFNKKGYLWRYLKRKLSELLKKLHPLHVWSHLIECNRKIRTVHKCSECTRFYVCSNTIMRLINNTIAIDYLQLQEFEISDIFSGIKSRHVDLRVYYQISDFINRGPESANFGSIFKDLIDPPFACFILYAEVFVRTFFNQMRDISDFIILNYFRYNVDSKSQKFLEKTLMNVYCLHLKYLM